MVGFSGQLPEYYRNIYGDASITWVPPVHNYNYPENIALRGITDNLFRWEEVSIDLETVQSGALLEFTMPDQYIFQITPNIGWHDELAMFGEYKETKLHNPHLVSLGPFSIEAGSLTDIGDNSVTLELSEEQMNSVLIKGYKNFLWRAVPWGDNNPGLGGFPASFDFISTVEQLRFTVDNIVKETKKSVQTITGHKGKRVELEIEDENNPTVYVEDNSDTWKVSFVIDRPRVRFKIKAIDASGSALSVYQVDISYDNINQVASTLWNAFDSFALLASLDRLPNESNNSLKNRTIDAFSFKGGTSYKGLVYGINRELGLQRFDSALSIAKLKNENSKSIEDLILIESLHTKISVHATSFIIYDEVKKINSYTNIVKTDKHIFNIVKIKTLNDIEIPVDNYEVNIKENIILNNEIIINGFFGPVKITYSYQEDIDLGDKVIGQVAEELNNLVNPNGNRILSASVNLPLSGLELAKNLYKDHIVLDTSLTSGSIGWSPISINSISNRDYKWSFAADNIFFNSQYYQYVVQLKSTTNIEWGHVVTDEDFWDSIESDTYGKDNLPIVFDIPITNYATTLAQNSITIFDPWQAFRMSYFYDSNIIRNNGFPQKSFRSGVGFKRDCRVSVYTKEISSSANKVNLNPISYKAENTLDLTANEVNAIKLTI